MAPPAENPIKKPNLKKITIKPFTGKPNEISIDKYLRAFSRAEETDIQLNGTTWDNDTRYHVLTQKLDGPALEWFDRAMTDNPPADDQRWKWLQDGLKEKFPVSATTEQIREQLKHTRKVDGETWTAYAQRLETVEAIITHDNMDLVRLMLVNADASIALAMKGLVIQEGDEATSLEDIVMHLTRLSGHDGTRGARKARTHITKGRNRPNKRQRCEVCRRNNHATQDCHALTRAKEFMNTKPQESDSKEKDFPLRG